MAPRETSVIVGGSNSYCTVERAGGTWTGFYRSTTSGTSWVESLLPGYPTDTSPEGLASPLQQRGIANAGDPVHAWDLNGRLFSMGNAYNRPAPQNGLGLGRALRTDAARHLHTVIVGSGTPALNGRFDKTAIEVDRGVSSPYQGTVHAAWSIFQGVRGNDSISFVHSTDHRHLQPADVDLDRLRGRPVRGHRGDEQRHGLRRLPAVRQQPRPPVEQRLVRRLGRRGPQLLQARHGGSVRAVRRGRLGRRPGRCGRGARPGLQERRRTGVRGRRGVGRRQPGLGSGSFACQSGFVFFRHDSQPRITADPKAADQKVYLVYDATIPGTEQVSRTTYNTADPVGTTLRVGQGGIYYTSLNGVGGRWTTPTLLAPTARGHQLFPDINADGGYLLAVRHDSRNDAAYSVQYPPGNNGGVRDIGGFAQAVPGLDTYATSSTTEGATWATARRISTVRQMPNYEMFGDRRVPCHGDYNYVSSVGAFAFNTWTDTRQVVGGNDPRYIGGEGFDVKQCRPQLPTGTFGVDNCPNDGGLDQDIFGAATTG